MGAAEMLVKIARRLAVGSLDVVVAAALMILAVAAEAARHAGAVPLIALAGCAATVSLRRRAPAVACLLALACIVLFHRTGGSQGFQIPVIVLALDYYTLGHETGERGWRQAVLPLLALPSAVIDVGPEGGGLVVVALAGCFAVLPFVAGWAISSRSALTRELRAANEQLIGEHHHHARLAAGEERIRVARELHDVVAHRVSVMVIQAVAARRVAGQDRELAREALRSVESCGREALSEMRRMVGVLRRGEIEAGGVGAPGLLQLDTLVARARASGLPVELVVEGERCRLPAGVELAAFRVVQEALTNTLKHAGPARARVVVRYTERQLELEISDTGNPRTPGRAIGAGGNGLSGMRERVNAYGGELQAGRRQRGGFLVTAHIPTGELSVT